MHLALRESDTFGTLSPRSYQELSSSPEPILQMEMLRPCCSQLPVVAMSALCLLPSSVSGTTVHEAEGHPEGSYQFRHPRL